MNPALKPTKKEIVTEFRTREILAAARRLMQSRGVEAVTVEEIAAAAGVAKGTVYLYFQGKEDLIQALMTQVGENLIQDLETLLAKPGTTGEKLNVLVTGLMKFVEAERFLFPFYVRDVIRGAVSERQGLWEPSPGSGGEVYGAVGPIFCPRGPGRGVYSGRPAASQLFTARADTGGRLLSDDPKPAGRGGGSLAGG